MHQSYFHFFLNVSYLKNDIRMNMSYVSSRPLFVKTNGQQIEAGRRLVTWRRPEILPGYTHL